MSKSEKPKISYARGFPYGAPLAMVRGGGTKFESVKDYLRAHGFRWDSERKAWTSYKDREMFGEILKTLRDEYGCNVVPKDNLEESYKIDLDNPTFGRPAQDD